MSKFAFIAVGLCLLACVGQAQATPIYNFTYSDTSGDAGYGTLSAVDDGWGDGGLLVTSGTLNLTGSADGNGSVGTYSIMQIVSSPSQAGVNSPSGKFIVDNVIYPEANAVIGIPAPSAYIDNDGLLFGQPGTGSQAEVNIWGNGGGDYALYTVDGNDNSNISTGTGGTFTLTAVPEPEPITILAALMIASSIAAHLRRRVRLATA